MKRAAGDEPHFANPPKKRRSISSAKVSVSSSSIDDPVNGVSSEKAESASSSKTKIASVERGIVDGAVTDYVKNTRTKFEERQHFYSDSASTEEESEIGDEEDEYKDELVEELYRKAEEMARQLGDLVNLRPLVDYSTAIPNVNRLPPEFRPSLEDIKTFEARFGPASFEGLEYHAHAMSPNPSRWDEGHRYLNDFFVDWTQREPSFAGSKLSSYLLPTSVPVGERHLAQPSTSLSAELDQQAMLLDKGYDGFLLTSEQDFGSVSASKAADATYSLDISALSEAVQGSLRRGNKLARYPCLHANANRVAPMISVEVKVDGGVQKQTLQQTLYGTWNVYRQLIVRFLTGQISKLGLKGIRHYSFGVFDDNLSIWEYTPVNDKMGLTKSLRIQARLLCKGSMHDEDWFSQTYCAWRLYIAKLAIFDQTVFFLPDIDRYAALPPLRPFDHGSQIFISAQDFVLNDFQLDRPSFGNRPCALQADIAEQVHIWRFQMGLVKTPKRRSQAGSSRQASFSQQPAFDDRVSLQSSARESATDLIELGTASTTRKKQRAEEPVNSRPLN